jgi:hypothetical protein
MLRKRQNNLKTRWSLGGQLNTVKFAGASLFGDMTWLELEQTRFLRRTPPPQRIPIWTRHYCINYHSEFITICQNEQIIKHFSTCYLGEKQGKQWKGRSERMKSMWIETFSLSLLERKRNIPQINLDLSLQDEQRCHRQMYRVTVHPQMWA